MELLHTAHLPAGDGPFPTIIALHGWGASAHDLIGLAPILHGGQAMVLCPEGPVSVPVGEGIVGFGWFPLAGGAEPNPDEYARGLEIVEKFVDAAVDRYPVDPSKLVLLGFSQGGVMAYDLALRKPERFAALAALSSWLPPNITEGKVATPELANLATLVMHGTEDPMIPVDRARESRDSLIALGVQTTYREYEMGHEIRPEALRDLVGWFEEKAFPRILIA